MLFNESKTYNRSADTDKRPTFFLDKEGVMDGHERHDVLLCSGERPQVEVGDETSLAAGLDIPAATHWGRIVAVRQQLQQVF